MLHGFSELFSIDRNKICSAWSMEKKIIKKSMHETLKFNHFNQNTMYFIRFSILASSHIWLRTNTIEDKTASNISKIFYY